MGCFTCCQWKDVCEKLKKGAARRPPLSCSSSSSTTVLVSQTEAELPDPHEPRLPGYTAKARGVERIRIDSSELWSVRQIQELESYLSYNARTDFSVLRNDHVNVLPELTTVFGDRARRIPHHALARIGEGRGVEPASG